MARFNLTTLLLAGMLSASIGAYSQTTKKPLTNDDVVGMQSSGLAEDVIIGAITANDVDFDVTPGGLMSLKKAQVGDKILQAMLTAEAGQRNAAAKPTSAVADPSTMSSSQMREIERAQQMFGANPAAFQSGMPTNLSATQHPVQRPKVTLVLGDKRQPVEPSVTEVVNGKGNGSSVGKGVAKGFGKTLLFAVRMSGVPVPTGGGGRGGPGTQAISYVWALPGRTSAFSIPSTTPKFEIEFAEIPGVDPDEYEPVLEKLIQTQDNYRLVAYSRDKFDQHGNDTRSVKTEDRTLVEVTELGRGHLVVSPAAPLPFGEYGLILHPKKNQKEYVGVSNSNTDAIFAAVWDFSIAAPSQ